MRWSQLFIPTLREAPADAEIASHKLLLRAGYIRQLGAGMYNYLYLAQRSMLKITAIVREEMDRIGAQEFYLPALHPAEIWQESGRWAAMGPNMFRLKDRAQRDLCLGMTHEEVMTDIARRELRSYKQLPQIWYQIQNKFRDEPRPRSGLLRTRQFTMKDSYSFDIGPAGLDESYQKHHHAYCRIFERCGLCYTVVEAYSGAMGGSQSHEFMVLSEAGEDLVAQCEACGYSANLEKAVSRPSGIADEIEAGALPEPFHTPGQKTIAEVSAFDGRPDTGHMKSLVYISQGRPVMIVLRGDHELSETKLTGYLGDSDVRPAHPEEVRQHTGAMPGSVGPVGFQGRILIDGALEGRRALVTGANRDDYHLRNVTPGRDFQGEFADLRVARAGDLCPSCDGRLRASKAIEVGHIFKLGYKYSESMGARVLDAEGREVTLIMGSYGIGIERILTAAIEQNHDENGMALPISIAPFHVVITPVHSADAGTMAVAEEICTACLQAGLEVLFDDRDEHAGVKFKDADLIGVPFRVNVGRKVSRGLVEVVRRSPKSVTDVKIAEAAACLREACGGGQASGPPAR